MKKKVSLSVTLVLGLILLTGCTTSNGRKTDDGHASSTRTSQSSKTAPKKANSNSANNRKTSSTVTFASNTLTTSDGTLLITGQRQVASAFANYQQLLITYTFTNNSTKQVAPADVWSKFISAKQSGRQLVTGSLSLTGGNSDADNDAINNSVTPLNHGNSATVAAMYKISPSDGPVTLTIKDEKTVIGTTQIEVSAAN